MVCDLLLEESNIQPVSTPVTVCGDIHGQVSLAVNSLHILISVSNSFFLFAFFIVDSCPSSLLFSSVLFLYCLTLKLQYSSIALHFSIWMF